MRPLARLSKLILWVVALWVLIETLDVLRRFNFAAELPELLWLQWTWLHWLFLLASYLISLMWCYRRLRAAPVTTFRLLVFGVIPLAVVTAPLLPALLAAPKVYSHTA